MVIFAVNVASAQKKNKQYTSKVYLTSNKVERGVLQSADEKGIYILDRRDSTHFIDLSQIAVLKLRPKKAASRGAVIGLLTGLAIGATATYFIEPDDALERTVSAVGTAGLSFASMAIGGSIGSRARETFQINGNRQDFLQHLQQIKSFSLQ